MKQSERLREGTDAAMKHLMIANVDCHERCSEFSRDALLRVVTRTDQNVVAQVKPDSDKVLKQTNRRTRHGRRSARSRLCPEAVPDVDTETEDKENVCYSKHFLHSDSNNRRGRRHDALSSVKFHSVTCSSDHQVPPELSSRFDKLFVDVPLTGRPCHWRSSHAEDKTLMHPAASGQVGRSGVLDVVRHGSVATATTAGDDTSVWSAVSVDDRLHPPSTAAEPPADSGLIADPELSRISSSSSAEQRELREQTSSGDLTGAFHSTFSYPLHSTLLVAAVTSADVSDVVETVAEHRHDLRQIASADAPPVGSSKSTSDVAQDVDDIGHEDCSTNDKRYDFRFDDVTACEVDLIETKSKRQNMKRTKFSCCTEAGGDDVLGRLMSYFPPLSTTVHASTSSADIATATDINMPLWQQDNDDDGGGGGGGSGESGTVRDSESDQMYDVDTSVEALRGSPCDNRDDPTSRLISSQLLDVDCRLTPSCRRCLDARRTAHRSSHRRQGRCVGANLTSKSGGRETSRMVRETGRCDLRHTFHSSQDVGHQSLTVRDLFRVYRSHQRQSVNSGHRPSTCVHQRQRQCRRIPRRSRCRCGVEHTHLVDSRVDRSSRNRRHSVLPPGESENKRRVKQSERYFDPVRKRTLVNRLKHFTGCFCDTGCGRRMRTLANV